MKERLNLTIDGVLLASIKAYAASKGVSVSELVESYFRSVTKPAVRKNILDLVDELDPAESIPDSDFPARQRTSRVVSTGVTGGSFSNIKQSANGF